MQTSFGFKVTWKLPEGIGSSSRGTKHAYYKHHEATIYSNSNNQWCHSNTCIITMSWNKTSTSYAATVHAVCSVEFKRHIPASI